MLSAQLLAIDCHVQRHTVLVEPLCPQNTSLPRLGLGPDGHILSLFAGVPASAQRGDAELVRHVAAPEQVEPKLEENLTKLKKYAELAPAAWQGFLAFDKAAMADGAIPAKTKELLAIAVALTTQCPYCIEIHSKKAKKAGATEQELAETTLVAAALRAGGAVAHGTHTLE